MNKLMKHLLIILIGLSNFSCDPEESFDIHIYERTFRNNSDNVIKVVYYSLDSENFNTPISEVLMLPSNTKLKPNFELGISSEGVEEGNITRIIENNVSIYYDFVNQFGKFELLLDDNLIKEWNGPPGYLGNEINNPFNYDSWEVINYEEPLRQGNLVIEGEIIFTTTNDDLVN